MGTLAMANWADPIEIASNPMVAFALRAALGAYVVWMARGFYADPMSYFRQWMPRLRERAWAKRMIRGWAAFCLWGGCFIFLAAVATQILDLHGLALAVALVTLAAIAAFLLAPTDAVPILDDEPDQGNMRRLK